MAASQAPVIVWFRRELRLSDNAALAAAAKSGAALLPLYILDDETPGDLRMGGVSRWWLHGSLKALDESLDGHLCLKAGAAPKVLAALLDETSARAIHAIQGYQPWDTKLEEAIATLCKEKCAGFHLHPGRLLFAPDAVRTSSGDPYKVFTPFWKACLSLPEPRAPLKAPKLGEFAKVRGEKLDALKLLPKKPDWARGLRETWLSGEAAAKQRLLDFIDGALESYAEDRSNLFGDPTSRLSPYLQFERSAPIRSGTRYATQPKDIAGRSAKAPKRS